MDSSFEIRKLPPSRIKDLVQILEVDELWKRLMCIIPKRLMKTNYVCDVTVENPFKYNSEHFRLIEIASVKYRRACTEILFDEWGTHGKVRPALGHLLSLLTKAKLFRAADYVAVDILHQEKPQRPSGGPEALISVVLPVSLRERNRRQEESERSLDQIGYVASALSLIRTNSEELARQRNNNNIPTVIPQIVISPDIGDNDRNGFDFNLPLVVQKGKTSEIPERAVSDMIQFSTTNNISETDVRPEISGLLNEISESNLPDFDMMNGSVKVNSGSSEKSLESSSSELTTDEVPSFSQLLGTESSESKVDTLPELKHESEQANVQNIPNLSILNNLASNLAQDTGQVDLPNLSLLNADKENSTSASTNSFLPDFSMLKSSTDNIGEVSLPNISALGLSPPSGASNPSQSVSVNISTRLLPTSLNSLQNSTDNSSKSRPCTSPLPNLSLNTHLPHFSYFELEKATNNFNTASFVSVEDEGRFLGSGAFGSVFLAVGLLDRPVAVKKLVLENVEVVNVNDTVTKQFRNEVEVLSKYKHENLLSLLGYSCDGCTYCLMYEYITGGALKDRLQATQGMLGWKERLHIAVGTAKALSYLHSAFSTPLIHRDVKSANILLDAKNNPKLGDFGLIKLSPSQNTNTVTTIFGTSAYMAPEAFRGDISVKLDTFSFGVVLLELLTSLPSLDENREGGDLVTHIYEKCENDNIMPLLDQEVGSWQENGTNFADELFKISLKCLEEKKKRLRMVEVTKLLQELLDKFT